MTNKKNKKRYKIEIKRERCKGCGLCVSVCKKDVIALSKKFNEMSYNFAEVVNEENCTGCANCGVICPEGTSITIKEY